MKNFKVCFSNNFQGSTTERFIKRNNNNLSSLILNVGGGCLGSPVRAGYGGVLRNDADFYLSGFSGYIHGSSDIMFVELYAIYKGFLLAKDLNFIDLICYSDSLHCVNFIPGPSMKFHVYAVLIQEINELLVQVNVIVCHTLRDGNQCADFMVKLGTSSNIEFLLHASPPDDQRHLLKIDVVGTFFYKD